MKPSQIINIPQSLDYDAGHDRPLPPKLRRANSVLLGHRSLGEGGRANQHVRDGPGGPALPPDRPAINPILSGHRYHFFFFAVFLSVLCRASAEDKPNLYAGYNLAARAAVTLDENFYNPFKFTARQAALPLITQSTLTNEQIAQLLEARKIQGLIFGADGVTGKRAIIGDEVFAVGDEIAFYNNDYVLTRLSSAGIVRLVKITRDSLEFEISVQGLPSRRMDYSLGAFFTP
jgi:hypothetical protein